MRTIGPLINLSSKAKRVLSLILLFRVRIKKLTIKSRYSTTCDIFHARKIETNGFLFFCCHKRIDKRLFYLFIIGLHANVFIFSMTLWTWFMILQRPLKTAIRYAYDQYYYIVFNVHWNVEARSDLYKLLCSSEMSMHSILNSLAGFLQLSLSRVSDPHFFCVSGSGSGQKSSCGSGSGSWGYPGEGAGG